jgi:hypothetical protein
MEMMQHKGETPAMLRVVSEADEEPAADLGEIAQRRSWSIAKRVVEPSLEQGTEVEFGFTLSALCVRYVRVVRNVRFHSGHHRLWSVCMHTTFYINEPLTTPSGRI